MSIDAEIDRIIERGIKVVSEIAMLREEHRKLHRQYAELACARAEFKPSDSAKRMAERMGGHMIPRGVKTLAEAMEERKQK